MSLFRAFLASTFILLVPATSFSNTGTDENVADAAITAPLETAELMNKRGQFQTALLAITNAETGELYAKLSPGVKYRVDTAYAYASFHLGMGTEALRAYARATSFAGADRSSWYWRFHAARLANDFADAYSSFKVLRQDPSSRDIPLNDGNVHTLDQGFGTLADTDAQLEFESYLESSGWKPVDPFFSPDVILYHFAQNLHSAGDKSKAAEVAARVSDPIVLSVMLADKRFYDASSAENPTLKINDAASKLLNNTRATLMGDPNQIEAHSALATRLELLGRPEEALSEINQTLANAAQLSAADRQRYDFYEQHNHALVVKAFALFQLGRFDEALGIASAISSCGCRPAEEILLSAKWLIDLNRGSEALANLSPMTDGHLTLEGRGDLAALRACGAAQTGDKVLFEKNVQYLEQEHLNRPAALLRAFLCADDLDNAADTVVAALRNPNQRGMMLQMLQRYKPANVQTRSETQIAERLDALRSRTEVSKTVDEVGRINRYDIVNLFPLY